MRRQEVSTELPGGVWLTLECGHDRGRTHRASHGIECPDCDLRWIPPVARPARRTPTFTSQTVPKNLLDAHTSASWAKLVVTSGDVTVVDEQPEWRRTADCGRSVVIVPGRCHHIEPAANAEFHVEFYSFDVSAAA